MREFKCPDEITAMFEGNEEQKQVARPMALAWAESLDLHPGDKVWLPEIGWCIHEPTIQ